MKPEETVCMTGKFLTSRGDVFHLQTDSRIVFLIEQWHLHACFVKMMAADSGVTRGNLFKV